MYFNVTENMKMKYVFVVGFLLGTYHLFYSICFSTGIAKNAKIIVRYYG